MTYWIMVPTASPLVVVMTAGGELWHLQSQQTIHSSQGCHTAVGHTRLPPEGGGEKREGERERRKIKGHIKHVHIHYGTTDQNLPLPEFVY